MSLTMSTDTVGRRASESQWAVETHGLTKRFGDNTAVNDVELNVREFAGRSGIQQIIKAGVLG